MKFNKKTLVVTIIFILAFLIYLVYFKKPTKIVLFEPSMEDAFIEYIRDDLYSADSYQPVHEIYEAHKVFEVRKKLNLYYVYTYLATKCYNGKYSSESSGSGAIVFVMIKKLDETYKLIKVKEPLFGEDYVDSLRSLFPDYIAENILNNHLEIYKKITKSYNKIK